MIVLKCLCALLGLVILVFVFFGIYNKVQFSRASARMRELGLYNPVSVGDHSLNVNRVGNPDGDHKIVVLSGWGDGTLAVSWHYFTEPLEENNEIIFIDRPGYGLSDDTDEFVTLEWMVNEYRTALKNAGIEGPYVLLAHSIGGLYTTYWESTYPDEVEAAIIMDGTDPLAEITPPATTGDKLYRKFFPYLERLICMSGMNRISGTGYEEFFAGFSEENARLSVEMLIRTGLTKSPINEIARYMDQTQQKATWDCIVPNDIPKMYICSTFSFTTKEELINAGFNYEISSIMTKTEIAQIKEDTGLSEDDYYDFVLAWAKMNYDKSIVPYVEKLGNCRLVNLPGDHVIFLDRPQETQALILDFLAELD